VIDLNAVVGQMERMLQRMIGEDVALEFRPAAGLDAVLADPGQIEQVIMNLAVNARDAMPTGGRLTIRTGVEVGTEGRRWVRLEVADTGSGMDARTRERIFEPFFTTKEPGRGTGLGLATVYGVVSQSGGSIDVESTLGRGTTFAIRMPAVDGAPVPEMELPIPPRASQGRVVLVVEDEESLHRLMRAALEAAGHRVLVCASGPEALAAAAQEAGEIAAAVIDVVMPQMSGRELADRLAAARPGLPVLFVSGYTDDAIVRHGVREGSRRLLVKPFSMSQLVREVESLLSG
jgi:CheY-like chemotaxis protein